jgi:hypothetical protein
LDTTPFRSLDKRPREYKKVIQVIEFSAPLRDSKKKKEQFHSMGNINKF